MQPVEGFWTESLTAAANIPAQLLQLPGPAWPTLMTSYIRHGHMCIFKKSIKYNFELSAMKTS